MSLVDYASSDEEDDASIEEDRNQPTQPSTAINATEKDHDQPTSSSSTPSSAPPLRTSGLQLQSTRSSLDQQSQDVSPLLPPPIEKLPDASFLLSSPMLSQPFGTDHSSRVAAAMAENASRKREANGSSSAYIRGKVPKGNLPHPKNIPDTVSGLLVPPQLSGRSNVVTEDISKLFVRKDTQGRS